MKKIFLTILIISSLSSINLFAEDRVISENNNFNFIDEKYASQMDKIDLRTALEIENEKYSSPEELYMAGLYFYGSKKDSNIKKASILFKEAAYKGFQPAKYMIGKIVLNNESNIITKMEATEILKSIKEDYHYERKSFELLANKYINEKDYNNAIIYLSKIKDKESLYRIAKIYEYKGDKETANMIYRQAIANGYLDAKLDMAKRLLNEDVLNTKKAILLLEDVSLNGGNVENVSAAQTLLGDIYFYGNQQMYADHEKGVSYYKKASNNNYPEAMIKLHKIYLENEVNNQYRLGNNKFEIHDLGVKIRNELYDK